MQEKTANELRSAQSHRFQFVAVFIIPPSEGYFALMKADQTVIGNGNTMRVSARVIQNLFRTAKGRFAIHNPLGFAASFDERLELLRIVQFPNRPKKLHLPDRIGFFPGSFI